MATTPTIAIVGRPNVGKSTLFNRLVGRRQAIVHDQPGVTRDRIFGMATMADERPCQLIDTGGLVPGDDPLGLNEQVMLAVEESDLLLLVVDGKDGLVPADEEVWAAFRRRDRPVVLVVNKADTRVAQEEFEQFYALGVPDLLLLSAEHGTGVEALREALAERFRDWAPAVTPEGAPVAIVGRPNVGKSSILNRIVGTERTLVSPVAGTTRDPIDTPIIRDGKAYVLIDTAGIRRRSQVTGVAEGLAVMLARRQIERSQVAALVVDAAQGVTSGDLAIASAIWELGRGAVVLVNKWDLLDPEKREALDESYPRLDEILSSPERVNVSALTGRSLVKLFPALEETLVRHHTQLGTSELNRIFEQASNRHRPPHEHGRPWKLFYATQVSTGPPTFMLFANRTLARQDSYRRYLENQLREAVDLRGIPVRLVIRKR